MPLQNLNKEQLEAATSKYDKNLIIASAGTGKTSTIVGRIAHLINSGINPNEIMLLTFTNKAAAEMIARVARYFGKDVAKKIEAGTFHAISYRVLKKEDKKVVLKQQRELKTLFKSIYEKQNFFDIDSDTQAFSSNYLYDLYILYQNTELKLEFYEYIYKNHDEHRAFADIYQDIIDEYEKLKKEFGFLNFNDLLIEFRELAKTKKLGYKEVLVDEYQDTNLLQESIIEAINPPSLFCVGDYDQSIYAFNGADINIIASFTQKYPDAKVFNLSKNYRSTKPILELADKVISYNERIYPKKLEVTKQEPNFPPKLLVFDELFDQYHGIAKYIQNSNTPHEEIAVIFRNNATADGIEVALRELGINSKRKGGNSFFDAKEVKFVLDLYTLVVNPTDMMAFIHTLEYAKGIGSGFLADMFLALKKLGKNSIINGLYNPDTSKDISDFVNVNLGLFDEYYTKESIKKYQNLGFDIEFLNHPILKHPKLTKESATYIYNFYILYKKLLAITNPTNIIQEITSSNLFEYVKELLANKRAELKDKTIDERLKEEALTKIKRKMLLLEDLSKPYNDSERFLNAMILGSNDLTQGDGVNLLSIHASKGLEFREVYVIDLMDGRFPNRKLANRSGGSIEEERRLFYVAVTRAKEILYLSFAKYDKVKKTEFLPSQFLYEAGLVKKDENYKKLVFSHPDNTL